MSYNSRSLSVRNVRKPLREVVCEAILEIKVGYTKIEVLINQYIPLKSASTISYSLLIGQPKYVL